MPLLETKGAASAQGFGEFSSSGPVNYIEDVFSTYLYTGNGSTQTITNGIDLSTKGGLVWLKARNNAQNNFISDTVIGRGASRCTNSTSADAAETLGSTGIQSFNSTGFTVNLYSNFGSGAAQAGINNSANNMSSWTFREQEKFFDIVTWTGNGSNPRTISHNLNATPGCIIVKKTSATTNWFVYHRSLTNPDLGNIYLNATNAEGNLDAPGWGVTSTGFTARAAASLNDNGATYVAYLFAHNAGGFGLSGTDNVISCGSYTGNGSTSGPVITLGYEPQWILVKEASAGTTENWYIVDSMRGLPVNGPAAFLSPNNANSEATNNPFIDISATGFRPVVASSRVNTNGSTYIYIAIRRGPMKVPTSGTSVFSPNTSSSPAGTVITTGFPLDASLTALRAGGYGNVFLDRLRGFQTIPYGTTVNSAYLVTNTTGVEQSLGGYSAGVNNTGFQIPNTWADLSTIYYSFRRAPGFFDVVCYTGTGVARTINHNLAAVPEMVIIKSRTSVDNWWVYQKDFTGAQSFVLNLANAVIGSQKVSATSSTTITLTTSVGVNDSGNNYVAYLFATVAGVSKVGSYTGTGTTQVINCGFTAGSRFVMIKRTDSTGDWYVWDSARGIGIGTLIGSYYANGTTANYGLGTGEYRIYYNTSLATWFYNAGTYSGQSATQAGLESLILSQTGWYVKTGTLMASGAVNFYRLDRYTTLPANDDPYLLLNSTAAEVTNTDYLDTAATGFEISSTAPAAINANGGSFIFLAIA